MTSDGIQVSSIKDTASAQDCSMSGPGLAAANVLRCPVLLPNICVAYLLMYCKLNAIAQHAPQRNNAQQDNRPHSQKLLMQRGWLD